MLCCAPLRSEVLLLIWEGQPPHGCQAHWGRTQGSIQLGLALLFCPSRFLREADLLPGCCAHGVSATVRAVSGKTSQRRESRVDAMDFLLRPFTFSSQLLYHGGQVSHLRVPPRLHNSRLMYSGSLGSDPGAFVSQREVLVADAGMTNVEACRTC